ncbi:MAG: helix-turn-helix transcriptional regulator [Synechococcaceae cyanobacterium]|nr:helix-turn-helix transcriptional regulator [Synechococcaceae cyanobacterium]
MPKPLENLRITPSTGNVFRDVGFKGEEAEHLRIRADLMIRLQREISARGLTQAAAAQVFGVHPPRVSDLVRGRIDLFSIETLIEWLTKLGAEVRVVVRSSRSRSAR